MKTALLVIDVQNLLVEAQPYAIKERLQTWQKAIETCRQKEIEVIYVRHNDEELLFGTPSWEIHSAIAPLADEKIIDKAYNSAFKETDLQDYLTEKEIGKLVIIGMSTDYCVDTTVKVAFEYGYELAIVEAGTTTFDSTALSASDIIEHYETIWANQFAEVDFLEEILKEEENE